MGRYLAVFLVCWLAAPQQPAFAQADNAAAERARLANQRIHAESERRARELEAQQAAAVDTEPAVERVAARPVPTESGDSVGEASSFAPAARPPAAPPQSISANEASGAAGDVTETLEQIQKLGELWDAGYLTDDEFAQIKARILQGER